MDTKPPPVDDALVKEFVTAAHGDLDRTRELLVSHPELINAAWDWGGGDFETALGGAAHIPLIAHAEAGGADAEAVVAFLKESLVASS